MPSSSSAIRTHSPELPLYRVQSTPTRNPSLSPASLSHGDSEQTTDIMSSSRQSTRRRRLMDVERNLEESDKAWLFGQETTTGPGDQPEVEEGDIYHSASENSGQEQAIIDLRSQQLTSPSRPAPRPYLRGSAIRRATSSRTVSAGTAAPPETPPGSRKGLATRGRASDGRRLQKRNASLRDSTATSAHAGDAAEEEVPTRGLRKRSVQQTHPFTYEKHQHVLAAKTGKPVDVGIVEEAVQQEKEIIPQQPVQKKARKSTVSPKRAPVLNVEATKLEKVSSSKVKPASTELRTTGEYNPARTTLRVWLNGFANASVPTTLKDCDSLDKLIQFIVDSWEWCFEGKVFHYAIISFPWLTGRENLLIRPGLQDSFRKMVSEVESFPGWATADGNTMCEVEIMVYLQTRDGG
ncbi:hypothetical protein HRR83_004346 [Exophiala dermatitidis]|uniref:Uncharacterized protein n=2 Tax=Exophiala dermatitidis TaxID=5970 RepID=H6BQD9_EXODN|nr:uncharacterized protein HMPREF1120_02700 [Exophiala dermatitidis NIH/UT8656]KAJ4511615.1 hypothetical protein HRR73_006190 [Exophiala dermatitidis]EHY54532.1 hypothetical protein HMPREF1120_02700 [Exophiala dermatitidis NIH/UT8656]KAJ4517694.1 hypothetical protein HRR75_002912 [Exophiala dermatitidis]KAJ4521348.1 hypothetical protein HRR74_003171 [Exophiala dermatitidis]KAJ4542018.1 hypothetical protein HRR77_005907 [Exophiala dermatitidis]